MCSADSLTPGVLGRSLTREGEAYRHRDVQERRVGGAEPTDTPGHRPAAEDDRTSRPAWARLLFLRRWPPALTRRQWHVLGLVVLASFFEMYDLYLFALTLQQIQADLVIPEASLGLLSSLVRLGALPAGVVTVLADRIGRRRVLLGTILA